MSFSASSVSLASARACRVAAITDSRITSKPKRILAGPDKPRPSTCPSAVSSRARQRVPPPSTPRKSSPAISPCLSRFACHSIDPMSTEDINPRYVDLDSWDTLAALRAFHEDQAAAVAAVAAALPAIAKAVDDAAPRLRSGGRLVYVGAGTSARIGVQDGAELFPTFNWPKEQVAFAIAGGERALLQAIENAEDSAADGAKRIEELGVGPNDVVIGLAASGNTPFTVGAVKAAKQRGAMTVGIASNPGSQLLTESDHPILIETGAEPIAGSTRLKAGTAQKVVLNLFSTMVMVRLGRVYAGMMVDMRATTAK